MKNDEDDDHYDDDDEEHYVFKKGSLSKKRCDGLWETGIKIYSPSKESNGASDCACPEDESCHGRRVVHVFFKCPHCEEINGEHRAKDIMGTDLSLWCTSCDRHLWIRFSGWTDVDWEKAK